MSYSMNSTSGPSGSWINITYGDGSIPLPHMHTSPPFAPVPMLPQGFWPPAIEAPLVGEALDEAVKQILHAPEHMFNPINGGSYCADCPAGNFYMDDAAAHPYFIKEWEIG